MKKTNLLVCVALCFCAFVAKAQNIGINNTNPQAALDLNGDLRLRSAILTLPNGLNNDVDLMTVKSSVYMFGGGALAVGGCQITGFTGGVDGRVVTIFNNSVNGAIQLYDANFSISPSAAANKILTGTGSNAIIYGNGSVTLRYDGVKQKWTVIASNYVDGLSASPNQWLTNGNNIYNANSGNVGIGTGTASEKLDVVGNIKTTGEIKPNGVAGTAGQVLQSNGNNTMAWANATTNSGIGFGSWGDCSTNNISEYNPVADATGAAGDNFGNSVSISGNYAIVGSPYDAIAANLNQGSASIYQLSGGTWVLMQKITDAAGAANDNFGISVSISGNYAIVGAYSDDVGANTDQGSASIYQLSGGTWVLMQKITDAGGGAGDKFGVSVSISGNFVISGAYLDDVGASFNQGSVSIYQLSGGTWVLMSKIIGVIGVGDDYFGVSVSIQGNYAIVGASGDDVGGNFDQGSISIYQLIGGAWVFMNLITDATGASGDNFGTSVSISGNYAIVGASNDDVGANTNQGSASIYQLSSGTWVQMAKITDASGTINDFFGASVSIQGNYAIVGTYLDDVGASYNQGSATIYQRVGLGWQKLQYVTDPGGNEGDYFGIAVGIDETNKRFIIGAFGYGSGSGKVVFGKVNL
jgi:FG-GAP repeat